MSQPERTDQKAVTKMYEAFYVYATSRFLVNVAVEQVSSSGEVRPMGDRLELDPGIYRATSPSGLVPIGQADFALQTFAGKGNPPIDPPLRAQQLFGGDASDGVTRNGLG